MTWIIRNPSIYTEPYRLKADPDFSSFRETAAQANNLRGKVSEQAYSAYTGTPLSQSNNFDKGLQPGDLTKSMAVPWQSDFNECTTQPVDVTYDSWVSVDPDSEGDSRLETSRRCLGDDVVAGPSAAPGLRECKSPRPGPQLQMLDWSRGIPQTNAGDLKMVTEWSKLGFVILNPDPSERDPTVLPPNNKFISVERDQEPRA